MGGYGRGAICAADMVSGISGFSLAQIPPNRRVNCSLPAEEYVPDALGVLYGL